MKLNQERREWMRLATESVERIQAVALGGAQVYCFSSSPLKCTTFPKPSCRRAKQTTGRAVPTEPANESGCNRPSLTSSSCKHRGSHRWSLSTAAPLFFSFSFFFKVLGRFVHKQNRPSVLWTQEIQSQVQRETQMAGVQ